MLLTSDHPDFNKILVFFNDKWCRAALAANDEEGWIEIPDLNAMAPLSAKDINENHSDNQNISSWDKEEEINEWEEIKTIKKYGKVEFKRIQKTNKVKE